MSNTPLTIAIPTYKRCETVVSLVKSLLPQLQDSDELLVVDDASQDGTVAALEAMDRVRVIAKPVNEGMVKNWNTCLTKASHEWVCMIHDDDVVAPNALTTIRKAREIVREPALIAHETAQDDADQSFCYRLAQAGTWATLNSALVPSGVTLHQSIIETIGLFDECFAYSSDIEYFARICARFPSLRIESPRILSFVLHSQNYEYKTWMKPDFLEQLEAIEELRLKYAGLTGDKAKSHFEQRMNAHFRHMLKGASLASKPDLVRQIGFQMRNKSYLKKRNRTKAYCASLLNWFPRL